MKSCYLEPEAWPAEAEAVRNACPEVVLSGSEAQHLRVVLRTRAGEAVRLFDGQGRVAESTVRRCEKRRVVLSLNSVSFQPRPRARSILALAWTKALRRSWLMEKAVELEASGLWFWQAARSQGQLPDEVKEHWQAQCIAGAKQSGSAWLPEIRCLPKGLAHAIELAASCEGRYVLLEDGDRARSLDMEAAGTPGTAVFVLGPEGGFAANELEQLHEAGFIPVNLGRRILRWETAALLCLGLRWWAGQQ